MKFFGILAHFYQPPWQFPDMLAKIVEECYDPLLRMIIDHPYARFTVNINYSLIELLQRHGHTEILSLLCQASAEGKIELTGSGAYHPILPLLDSTEARRQIELNEAGFISTLGQLPGPGFFPPEMAFDANLAKILWTQGLAWTITDDTPFGTIYGRVPFDFIPECHGLPVFLRSHTWSEIIAFRKHSGRIFERLDCEASPWIGNRNGYIVVGMDAETFNHHHKDYIDNLRQFVDDLAESSKHVHGWKLAHLTEICRHFPKWPMDVPAGSWSTSSDDTRRGIPFPMWKHPHNEVHQLLWHMVGHALDYRDVLSPQARKLLDEGLNSCQFWWADFWKQNYELSFKSVPYFKQIALELGDRSIQEIKNITSQLVHYGYQRQLEW